MTTLKSGTEKDFIQTMHFIEKNINKIGSTLKEHGINITTAFNTLHKNYRNEKKELKNKLEEKLDLQDKEFKSAEIQNKYQQNSLNERVEFLSQDLKQKTLDCEEFEQKYSDFKKAITIINAYIPLPVDVQNGLLGKSQSNEIVSQSFEKMREVIENITNEIRKKDEIIHSFKKKLSEEKKKIILIEETLEENEKKNQRIREAQQNSINFYEKELKNSKLNIQKIKEKYEIDLNNQTIQVKSKCENALQNLQEQVNKNQDIITHLRNERKNLASQLETLKNQLINAKNDLDKKESRILELTQQNSETEKKFENELGREKKKTSMYKQQITKRNFEIEDLTKTLRSIAREQNSQNFSDM